jgi:hypothetical protein
VYLKKINNIIMKENMLPRKIIAMIDKEQSLDFREIINYRRIHKNGKCKPRR